MPIDRIDWGDTPDSSRVPYDAYHCTVREQKFDYSRNGKYMAIVQFQVDAPVLYKGVVLTENFVIGTDDDPQANHPDSWKRFGAQRLKQLITSVFDVAQLTGHPETDLGYIQGYPVGVIFDLEVDNNPTNADGTPNQYVNSERNRAKKFFNVQSPDAPPAGSLAGTQAGPTAAGPRAARPPARPPQRPPVAPGMAPAVAPPPSLSQAAPVAAAPPPAPPARPAPQRPAPPPPVAGRPAPPPPPPPRAA